MSVGLLTLQDRERVDFARLRAERRARLFAAMEGAGLDVLVLGRPANVQYASGARQLWMSGTRSFAPGCVVVRSTQAVHLLSMYDVGVPAEIPREHLYSMSWDPQKLNDTVAAIPGLAVATRLGTDAMTPMFRSLLGAAAPNAAFVDATATLRRARERKTVDELGCIRTAVALAEAGLGALKEAAQPGASERQLLGLFAERLAHLGAPTAASEGVACITGRETPRLRHAVSDRRIEPGDLVVLQAGALYAGYEGGISRTVVAGGTPRHGPAATLAARARSGLDTMIAACRAGATGADIRGAWASTQPGTAPAPRPPVPLAYGVGLGVESPVVADGIGDDGVLVAESVLAVQCWVAEDGVGGHLERDLVRVTDGEPEILTRG